MADEKKMINTTFHEELQNLESANLSRRLRRQENLGPTRAVIDGLEAILFAGNDYLGLSSHPGVIKAGCAALKQYGNSATASRLVSGNHPLLRSLEERLARLKGKEAALVFPSGYMANLGFVASVSGADDMIYMDRLAHASLYDGWRLSGAGLKRFRHNNVEHLEELLEQEISKRQDGKVLIITEGVFSMDGDTAPLPELKRLTDRHGCLLAVDDAHGTGVLGAGGKGTAAYLEAEPEVEIGTLSKAIGSLGGFVAGSQEIIAYLINKARPFIFTTGLPPASAASAEAAIRLLDEEGWRRERVLALAARARQELGRAGFDIPPGITPIIPLIVGDEKQALMLSDLCLSRGVFIPAIRTPAVPKNQARLRMTVSAAHTDDELDQAIDLLAASAGELGII